MIKRLLLGILMFAQIAQINASPNFFPGIVVDLTLASTAITYAIYRYNEYQYEKEVFKQFLDYLKADGCYQGKITQNIINAVDCYSRLTIEHFRDGAMMAYDRVYKDAPSNASIYDILKKIEKGELVVVS